MRTALKILGTLLLSLPLWGQSTVTVTNDLKTMFGGNQSTKVQVCFSLVDGANQPIPNPRVLNVGSIAATQNQCLSPDGSGHISTTVYANDQISPAGSLYSVQYIYNGRSLHGAIYQFLLADGTENLNTKPPINTPPVVPSPMGDNSYCRLDATNCGPTTDLWIGSGFKEYGSMAACYAAALSGQTCNIPANWSETFLTPLTMNKNAVGFLAHGALNITCSTGSPGCIIIPDGVAGAFIDCPYPFTGIGAFGSTAGCTFTYTGAGTDVQIGTALAVNTVNKLRFRNIAFDNRSAGNNAIGIDTYGLFQVDWDGVFVFGTGVTGSSPNNQIGLRMNQASSPSLDGENGTIKNSGFGGNNIGVQLNAVSYKSFIEVSFNHSPSWVGQGATAFDCNGCAAVNVFGGVTGNGNNVAWNFRNGASNNTVTAGCESNTNAAVFDSTSNQNRVICTNIGNYHEPSDAGTNNIFWHGGQVRSSRSGSGSNAGLTIFGLGGFPNIGFSAPTGGTNNKNYDITAQPSQIAIRAILDDNSNGASGFTLNRAAAGAGGAAFTSAVIGNTGGTAFRPDTIAFASLPSSGDASTNGSMFFCSNCTVTNPCANGGTGAIAKRLNGAWVCN